MTFEEFLQNAKNHAGDMFKAVTDMCFEDIVEITESKIMDGSERQLVPTLITVGMNPRAKRVKDGEKEVGLEIAQNAHDFPEYSTPSQRRALRKIADKVVRKNGMYPIAAFLMAEATSYQPNEEEMERIKASENPQEVMQEVAQKAKEEGRVLDICILAGMTFRKEMYFFTRLVDYDEQGNLIPLSEEKYEQLDVDYPLRFMQGVEGDEEEKGIFEEMNGNGIDTLYRFFAEAQPLMKQRLEEKLGMRDSEEQDEPEDRDINLAKTINDRTSLDWDTDSI